MGILNGLFTDLAGTDLADELGWRLDGLPLRRVAGHQGPAGRYLRPGFHWALSKQGSALSCLVCVAAVAHRSPRRAQKQEVAQQDFTLASAGTIRKEKRKKLAYL
jgi:hypothetical protein